MTTTSYEKDVKSAMKMFLLWAALIYAAAFTYSIITHHTFAQALISVATFVVAGIIYYAQKKL